MLLLPRTEKGKQRAGGSGEIASKIFTILKLLKAIISAFRYVDIWDQPI
jgi:hypothetical protein